MTTERDDLLRELDRQNQTSSADGMFLFQAIAQRLGMNVTDLQCLTLLASTGPLPAGRLTELMGLTTGAITGVVNRLETAGYVRRESDPTDARRVVIRPVMEAMEQGEIGYLGSQLGLLDELTSEFDDRELAAIVRFMRKANELTRREIDRLRFGPTSDAGSLSSPLGAVTSGRLVLSTGGYMLTLRAEPGMQELYRAVYDGPQPKIQVDGGTVTVRHPLRAQLFDWKGHSGAITLNATIPWEIELRRGAASVNADLRGLELRSLTISGGMSAFEIDLPEPSGVVPVRCSGGAAMVTFRRPAGVEAQVVVKGGAMSVTFDQQEIAYLASTAPVRSEGFTGKPDRYEFEFTGGASALTIT